MPKTSFAHALRAPSLAPRAAPGERQGPGEKLDESRQKNAEGAATRADEPDPDELEACSGLGSGRGRRGIRGGGGSGAGAFDGEDERLDPLSRALAMPLSMRPELSPQAPSPPLAPGAAPPLDRLVERFLKRFAMSSSRGRGVAHLEIGEGTLGGGRVTIEAEGAQVRVVIEGASGEAVEKWASALEKRLVGRGLEASVELR